MKVRVPLALQAQIDALTPERRAHLQRQVDFNAAMARRHGGEDWRWPFKFGLVEEVGHAPCQGK